MDGTWAAYAAALVLGAAHALEVDHMVAVTAFIGGRPRIVAATGLGLRWGIGHATVVMAAGALLAWSGARLPAAFSTSAEAGVGVTLLALGVWGAHRVQRLHLHRPGSHGDHAHLHAHGSGVQPHEHPHGPSGLRRRHRHLSTLVGAVHGLAGTAPVVALIPVAIAPDLRTALVYLAAFGIGTTVAMGAYAGLAALAVRRLGASPLGARIAGFTTSAASAAVGLWWLVRAVRGEG